MPIESLLRWDGCWAIVEGEKVLEVLFELYVGLWYFELCMGGVSPSTPFV